MTTEARSNPDRQHGARVNLEPLLAGYIAVCNRAIAENEDRLVFGLTKKLNRALWGETSFRTLVYDGDPSNVIGEASLHFDPAQRKLDVRPSADGEVAFSWKVSLDYLEDVVRNRPDWYVAHPVALDWKWLTDRVRDESRLLAQDRRGHRGSGRRSCDRSGRRIRGRPSRA